MKTKIFFINYVIYCFALQINAQTFDNNTIVNEQSSWAILNTSTCLDCPPVWTQYVYFDGDSVVADYSYKKVFSCNDEFHENIHYEGLMREQNQKTYFIPANSEIEYLLYDFSLETRIDYFYYTDFDTQKTTLLSVKNVDSIQINGILRKRIQLDYTPYGSSVFVRATWIEGIGSLNGLFHPDGMLAEDANKTVLCYFQNNELAYKNSNYSECDYNYPADLSEYIPLLLPGNRWNEFAENVSLGPYGQYKKTYTTKIGNETLLNDTMYYQLLTTKDEHASVWEENGYIREEIENRKVYYKPAASEPEMLLYDFGAEVGDVLQSYDLQVYGVPSVHYGEIRVEIKIEAVDYVLIDGSKLRKRMQVCATTVVLGSSVQQQKHTWIEGIGNPTGFLRSTDALMSTGQEQIYLLCFLQNEELVYKPENINIEGCFVWKNVQNPTIVQSTKNNDISIHPNPVDNILTVSSLNSVISRIEIFDISGKKIYGRTYENTIDVSSFSKGLYLLKAYDTNGQVSLFKIIKE